MTSQQIGERMNISKIIKELTDEQLCILEALVESEINRRCRDRGIDPEEVETGSIAWYNINTESEK